ncbi:hypothetical protein PAMP_007240 [Pampus punctatissimus]
MPDDKRDEEEDEVSDVSCFHCPRVLLKKLKTVNEACPSMIQCRPQDPLRSLDISSEDKSDAVSEANGLLQHLQKFGTFISLKLMLTFFLCVEMANAALQNSQLHSQKDFQLIEMHHKDIKHLCKNGLEDFWKGTNAAANVPSVDSPALTKAKKNPT